MDINGSGCCQGMKVEVLTFAHSPQIIIPRRIYWFRTSNKGGAVSYLATHFNLCLFLDWHPGSGISSHDQLLVLHLSRSGEWSLLTIKKKIGSHVNPVEVKRVFQICAFFCGKISVASITMSTTLSIYSITRSTTWSLMTRESWSWVVDHITLVSQATGNKLLFWKKWQYFSVI